MKARRLARPGSGRVARRLIRVGDLDDVQRLVQVCGVLPPLGRIEGKDRADGRIRDGGHVGVPRVKGGPGDYLRQADGLFGALERGDGDVLEQLKPLEEIGGFLILNEGHHAGVPAGDGDKDADIKDQRWRAGASVFAHLPS